MITLHWAIYVALMTALTGIVIAIMLLLRRQERQREYSIWSYTVLSGHCEIYDHCIPPPTGALPGDEWGERTGAGGWDVYTWDGDAWVRAHARA